MDVPGREASAAEELSDVLNLEPTMGEVTDLEGFYEVDPIPGGKRLQGAWLVLDDGTRYVISYRPIPGHLQFLEKRVRVRGCPYVPGSDVQHIGATHLEVQAIELAPGETPYAEPPTHPVLPPVARSAVELAARAGRWVRVVGTVEAVHDDPDSYFGFAWLRLPDGSSVRARYVPVRAWSAHLGKEVTVTSRLAQGEGEGSTRYELIGWYDVREGSPSCVQGPATDVAGDTD
jgi:hypothetical protein